METTPRARPFAGAEDNGNLPESPRDRVSVEMGCGARRQPVVRHPRQHLFDTDLKFQTGEVGAQAAMDSRTETEMPILAAIEDAAVGLGELTRVAVGRCVVHDHRLTG